MRFLDVGGLALATALASYFNLLLLILWLKKRLGKIGLTKILFSSLKSFTSAILTAIAAFYACKISQNVFVCVPASIFAGSAIFFITAKLLKSEELQGLIQIFKK
jgi:putative peptidoglycan lipid II flippase